VALLRLSDHDLEYVTHGDLRGRTLVFLHEGLGSVSAWREFPARLAEATGLGAFVFSRRGYGRSSPLAHPFTPSFMHDEARLLPAVLRAAGVGEAILVGHSDGASIALLHAASPPKSVKALLLEAPHVFVEECTVASIGRLRERSRDPELVERFRRHHGDNTVPLLAAWTGAWLDPAFRRWNIEASLPAIECPVLVIQGEDDEYGTLEQVRAIERGVTSRVETLVLPRCGHSPHRDRPAETIDAMARCVRALA